MLTYQFCVNCVIHQNNNIKLIFRSIKTQITLPFQWLNITFNILRTNSSSSSDSSDSDSDSDSTTSNISNVNISNVNIFISFNFKHFFFYNIYVCICNFYSISFFQKKSSIDYLQSAKTVRKKRQIGKRFWNSQIGKIEFILK